MAAFRKYSYLFIFLIGSSVSVFSHEGRENNERSERSERPENNQEHRDLNNRNRYGDMDHRMNGRQEEDRRWNSNYPHNNNIYVAPENQNNQAAYPYPYPLPNNADTNYYYNNGN